MTIPKFTLGRIQSSTDDITLETMSIALDSTETPTDDSYVNLYVDKTNNLMLTTINSENTNETLLEGTLE